MTTTLVMLIEVSNPVDLAAIFAYGFFFGTLYSAPVCILIFLPVHLILRRYRRHEWWAYAGVGLGLGLVASTASGLQGLFLLAQIFVPLSLTSTLAFWWAAIPARRQRRSIQPTGPEAS